MLYKFKLGIGVIVIFILYCFGYLNNKFRVCVLLLECFYILIWLVLIID